MKIIQHIIIEKYLSVFVLKCNNVKYKIIRLTIFLKINFSLRRTNSIQKFFYILIILVFHFQKNKMAISIIHLKILKIYEILFYIYLIIKYFTKSIIFMYLIVFKATFIVKNYNEYKNF